MYIATKLNSFYFLKKKIYQFLIWFNEITLAPSSPLLTISLILLKGKKKLIDLKSKTKLTSSKKLAQQRKLSLTKLKKKLSLIN